MNKSKDVTHDFIMECFDYDEITGLFTWRRRPLSHFSRANNMKGFNTKLAGKEVNQEITKAGYCRISFSGFRYTSHRLAWFYCFGSWPEHTIDHIDGDKMNNSINNLRDVPLKINIRNKTTISTNSSGTPNVYFEKRKNKWSVRLFIDGKSKRFGMYDDIELAELIASEVRSEYGYHENHGRKPQLSGI